MGITLCFVPLVLAFLLFAISFKCKITHLLIAILLGLIAVLPISFIQYFMPPIPEINISPVLRALLKSILLYGLVEELIKGLLLLPLPHKFKDSETNSCLSFLLLSFIAGLSLGCFESVVYYFDHLQLANSRGATLLYGQIAVRIFTSDLIHTMCTGLCGLFIYNLRNKTYTFSCIIFAILLHGFYDFFAGFSGDIRWFSIAVVLMSILECRIKYTKNLTKATNKA